MRARSATLLALSATLLLADVAPLVPTADAADPKLSSITPRGARRGSEVTFEFRGDRLADAQEVAFYGEGITVSKIEPDEKRGDKLVRVTMQIAEDARPGEHIVQMRTATGLTEFALVFVGTLPEVAEIDDPKEGGDNDSFESPQVLEPALFDEVGGVTVVGIVKNEDLDHYSLTLDKGQRLTVEVEGLRLTTDVRRMLDPAIDVLGPDGEELVADDDTTLLSADPVLQFVAPEAGAYVLRIRDAEFKGHNEGYYRMHVGVRPEAFPRPLAAYPAGGPAGEPVEVTFLGDVAGSFTQSITPELGRTANGTGRVTAVRDGRPSLAPLPFRASNVPNVLEAEPNDDRSTATSWPAVAEVQAAMVAAAEKAKADGGNAKAIEKAVAAVEIPDLGGVAFNGILETPGDSDFFVFVGKKYEYVSFDGFGTRIGSPIDMELRIYNSAGRSLKTMSDRAGLDPSESYRLPETGVYFVEVYDHLKRGGPTFVYRLEVDAKSATPTLSIPQAGRYYQDKQRIVIPRGNRFATRLTLSRDGLKDELAFDADTLPEGVTLSIPNVPGNQSVWPSVFAAAEDAPLGGTLTELRAYPAANPELKTAGDEERSQYAPSIIQGRIVFANNSNLWNVEAPAVAVAVVEKLPFSIEVLPPQAPLVRNGTLDLQILVHRDEGFEGNINLEFPHRTAGLNAEYRRTVKKDEDSIVYPLSANGKASLGTFPFYVLATSGLPKELNGVEYGGGNGVCSSDIVEVEVAETPFTLKLAKGAVRRTEATAIVATLENAEFEGTATVTLKGLPEGLSCEPVEVTAETESFAFEIQATEEAPRGTRKGLIAHVTLPNVNAEGEPIDGARTFTAGSTDLRVDAAPQKKPAKDTPAEPKVANGPAKPEPLTRLERLRREAAGLPTDSEGDTN